MRQLQTGDRRAKCVFDGAHARFAEGASLDGIEPPALGCTNMLIWQKESLCAGVGFAIYGNENGVSGLSAAADAIEMLGIHALPSKLRGDARPA